MSPVLANKVTNALLAARLGLYRYTEYTSGRSSRMQLPLGRKTTMYGGIGGAGVELGHMLHLWLKQVVEYKLC